jgi:hypothetical protein
LRKSFATFFGGAQWIGEGSPIAVTLNGDRFVFNLELMVDTYSGGFVDDTLGLIPNVMPADAAIVTLTRVGSGRRRHGARARRRRDAHPHLPRPDQDPVAGDRFTSARSRR